MLNLTRPLSMACIAFVGLLLGNLLWAPGAKAQEWTRFRGPNGQGVSEATTIPAQWTEADYNWKVKLPGMGHSSPVIWGERIFLMSADPSDATRYMLCLDAAQGETLWTREFSSTPHPLHLRSSYASCTPAVDAEQVYIAWSAPEKTTVIAFDHGGQTVWEKDLGTWVGQHGFGTSPILYKDLVILSNQQDAKNLPPDAKPGDSFMVAFDAQTGDERWRTPLESVQVNYSVPCIYQPEQGKPQLVNTSTSEGFYSLDPDNGQLNWTVSAFKLRTVSSPLLAAGLIFGSTGSGGGGNYVAAARLGNPPEIAYQVEREAPYVPCLVAHGHSVFLWSDKGVVACIDAPTGKLHWRQRVGGNYSGSPIRVRDKLYCIAEDGEVVVLAAAKEFRELGRSRLGEDSRATPAVAGGRMYLRTNSHLISVGGKSL